MNQSGYLSDDGVVKWGIIGVGDVCEKKSAPAMQIVDSSELVAVMRRNGAKARDYAERHNVPRWYDDADELLDDPEINAIYIATPPHVHLAYTQKAAARGKPVYVEKPMARTFGECKEMIACCQKAGVPLFTAYYRRALPNFMAINNLIEEDVIGEVRSVNITLWQALRSDDPLTFKNDWRVDPGKAGGGFFYDLASHQLDFLDFVFGEITEAKGFVANHAGLYTANDHVTGSFKFQSGILGTGSWCFTTSPISEIDQTTILGSKGEISYPTFGNGHVDIKIDGSPEKRLDFEMPTHIQQPLIETVVAELLGTGMGHCPSTGISGARTNWVMERLADQI